MQAQDYIAPEHWETPAIVQLAPEIQMANFVNGPEDRPVVVHELVVMVDDDQALPQPRPAAGGPVLDDPSAPFVPVPRRELAAPLPEQDSAANLESIEVRQAAPSPMPAARQQVARRSERPWLDIRPRGVAPDATTLLPADQLPPDTSGMPLPPQTPQLVQLYQADLKLCDIWAGASFCHQPLYFEDQNLERLGTTGRCLQCCPPLHSAVDFVWSTGTLPISVILQRPCSCVPSGYKAPRFQF
ncbi:hypothetical protein [Stieleria tagensis]|uniref:hypothetical protein n=1 Tax=Stieleria tagensis TaxID=2956795 RepID=UPI00209B6174|nr:hypothetical protein [Stieleria tagensis]